MNTLASRLNQAFDRDIHTQAQLARAARVKPPSVSAWMNGDTKELMAEPLLRAAEYLGVNAMWLATGEGPMRPDNAHHLREPGAPYVSRPAWPFPGISELALCALPVEDRLRLEGALVATISALGMLEKLRVA